MIGVLLSELLEMKGEGGGKVRGSRAGEGEEREERYT
jgi:hypothetical protein